MQFLQFEGWYLQIVWKLEEKYIQKIIMII